jgi:hypothetical protein
MQEPDVEGVATHDDRESCSGGRDGAVEALTGARTGRVSSRVIMRIPSADTVIEVEGNTSTPTTRGAADRARSKTPCTYGAFLRENREILSSLAVMAPLAASGRRIVASR